MARQADLCPGQIYRWRQDLAAASPGFAPVVVTALAPVPGEDETPAIEVRFGEHTRVRIPVAIPMPGICSPFAAGAASSR